MSNNNPIQALLKTKDLLRDPLKKIQTASESLSEDIGITQIQLDALNRQAARVDGYRLTQSALADTQQALSRTQKDTQVAALAFKNIEAPTTAQTKTFEMARESINQLQKKQVELQLSLQRQRQVLSATGVDTNTLTESDKRLRNSISQTTDRLTQQRKALIHVQAQKQREQTRVDAKQKIAHAQENFQSRQGMASKASGIGAAGLKGANTLVNAAIKLLKPGYEASRKRTVEASTSETQSVSQAQSGASTAAAPAFANNLGGDLDKLSATWQQLSVDIFASQEGSLRQLVQTATNMLTKLDGWVQKNGDLMQSLGTIAIVATGVMGVIGAIGYVAGPVITGINMIIAAAELIGPVFEIIGVIIGGLSWPVIGLVAVVAGAVLAIRKYWEPLSAFFSGVFSGVSESVKPLLDAFGSAFQTVFGWLDKISTPITSTQESLDSCRNAGVMFGHVLSNAFLFPLKALAELSDATNWVLEKLGLVDKKSASLPDVTQTQEVGVSNSYIHNTSDYPGYQGGSWKTYNPISTNSSGQNLSDNRVNNIHITMQGGSSSPEDVASVLHEQFNQGLIQQRASFAYP